MCLPGSTLEPERGKKVEALFYSAFMNPRVSHLGVFKYDVFQLLKGRNGEKRNSVIEIILKTAGFRISVLSNL